MGLTQSRHLPAGWPWVASVPSLGPMRGAEGRTPLSPLLVREDGCVPGKSGQPWLSPQLPQGAACVAPPAAFSASPALRPLGHRPGCGCPTPDLFLGPTDLRAPSWSCSHACGSALGSPISWVHHSAWLFWGYTLLWPRPRAAPRPLPACCLLRVPAPLVQSGPPPHTMLGCTCGVGQLPLLHCRPAPGPALDIKEETQ